MRNIVSALVVFLLIVVVGMLVLYAIPRVRQVSESTRCRNNLRIIGATIQGYGDLADHYPQAGKENSAIPAASRLSWMVELAPYFEATNLYMRMDSTKGWEAEENRYLALEPPILMCRPSVRNRPAKSTLFPNQYIGIAGLGDDAAFVPEGDPRAGFFGYERILGTKTVDSHCALIVVAESSQISGAWTAVGRATVRGLDENDSPYLGTDGQFGGVHPDGAHVVFLDGHARSLNEAIDPKVLEQMATIEGSKKVQKPGSDW
jgi:prepilin-type processing-associated H-X9-DG protein